MGNGLMQRGGQQVDLPRTNTKEYQSGQVPADRVVEWQPQFDRVSLSGTLSEHQFFVTGLDGGKTPDDTNVPMAGRLSDSEDFVLEGIAAQWFTTSRADHLLLMRGRMAINRTRQSKLELPIWKCGGGGGAHAAGSDNTNMIWQNGSNLQNDFFRFPSDPRTMRSPYAFKIEGGEDFDVTLSWSGLVTGSLSGATIVYVTLFGHFMRDADS